MLKLMRAGAASEPDGKFPWQRKCDRPPRRFALRGFRGRAIPRRAVGPESPGSGAPPFNGIIMAGAGLQFRTINDGFKTGSVEQRWRIRIYPFCTRVAASQALRYAGLSQSPAVLCLIVDL